MSSRRIQNFSETCCKDGYLQKNLPMSHFWQIYGQCTKFARVTTVSQVLVFYFTAPFSGCLQRHMENLVEHVQWSFFAKILNGFKLLIIFAKKLHHRCSTWLKIGSWLRAWNIELTLVPSVQITPKKYSARKYVWHRFWKGGRLWWDSKQNECLRRSRRSRGSLKKIWEISLNSQQNICAGISFLVFSCEFCEIYKNTFFAGQHRTTVSDYSRRDYWQTRL